MRESIRLTNSNFHDLMCKTLLEFKLIINRHLPRQQEKEIITQLKLRRKQIQSASDVMLYRIAQNVLIHLDSILTKEIDIPSWYSGLEEFRHYLKKILTTYKTINNRKVVHGSQMAADSITQALQLLCLPIDRFNDEVKDKLFRHGRIIGQYGDKNKQKHYSNVLRQKFHETPNLYLSLMKDFQRLTLGEGQDYMVA